MTYTVLILPMLGNTDNFRVVYDKLKNIENIPWDDSTNESVRKNGVHTEQRELVKGKMKTVRKPDLPNETVKFAIHPDTGVTQADIDKLDPETAFGNGMSTPFKINGIRCMIIVLKKNQTFNPSNIRTAFIDDLKSEVSI